MIRRLIWWLNHQIITYDLVFAGYEIAPDGSVTIKESVLGINHGRINISRSGEILSDMRIPYVKTLKEKGVKVDLTGVTGSGGYQGVDLSKF